MEAQYKKVLVCAGTGCVAGGSLEIFSRMKRSRLKRADATDFAKWDRSFVSSRLAGCM